MTPHISHRKAMTPSGPLHYVIGGEGPLLLLVHGWMGTWYSWRKVLPRLAGHFTVVAPDCRGYGESHKPAAGYDARTIKDDLRNLVAGLGRSECFVVGHDMGALPALLYAAEHRSEVLGLGYFDEPLPGYNLDRFTAFTPENPFVYWWFSFNAQPHLPALLWQGKEDVLVDHFVSAMVADVSSVSAEDKQEYVRGLRAPGALQGSFGWYRDVFVTARQILEATAVPLPQPVLAMNGQFGHPDVEVQMRGVAVDVVGVTIPNCGHLLAEEAPDAVADAIIGRFAGHSRT